MSILEEVLKCSPSLISLRAMVGDGRAEATLRLSNATPRHMQVFINGAKATGVRGFSLEGSKGELYVKKYDEYDWVSLAPIQIEIVVSDPITGNEIARLRPEVAQPSEAVWDERIPRNGVIPLTFGAT